MMPYWASMCERRSADRARLRLRAARHFNGPSDDLDRVFFESDDPVSILGEAFCVVHRVDAVAPLTLGDQCAVLDLARPQNTTQTGVVEPMAADRFVVRWLHARQQRSVPKQFDAAAVGIVAASAQR
jgi:hypothetical protein